MGRYASHRRRWNNCKACPLWETRTNVVLARGTVPCDVLFVGEAPGSSEDVLGRPMIGPAGKLLDQIIEQALAETGVTYALTNLVACIPIGEGKDKTQEPPRESIEACYPRLAEFVKMCRPKLVICVGALAEKHMKKRFGKYRNNCFASITHPANILRMNIAQQGLAIQRCVVTLADAVEELIL